MPCFLSVKYFLSAMVPLGCGDNDFSHLVQEVGGRPQGLSGSICEVEGLMEYAP